VRSVILETTARVLQPLILFTSALLLFIGHDSPGGGFVGGLVAAAAFTMHGLAHGHAAARKRLPFREELVVAVGLGVAVLTALGPLLFGEPAFTPRWFDLDLGPLGRWKAGTPLLFDIAIYFLVMGGTTLIVLTLEKE
jgi:multicomponent Na+:H+ antiporter subunit B